LRGLICGAILCAACPAWAIDPYEIQIYDGTADEPGHPGLEVHLNEPRSGPFHLTFEPSYGVLPFWEIGGYFQTGGGKYEGVKLRSKFVTPEGLIGEFRLGANFELSRIPDEGYGGEIRPILAWENERFLLAVNPIVGFGPTSFEPGGMAKLKLGPLALGAEYYASVSEHQQYLFEALDLLALKNVEVNFAVGEGLTAASTGTVVKMILGYVF
jgi:hypothetical protein